jgi:hypothetical protein
VDEKAKALLGTLPPGRSRTLVAEFKAAHLRMGADYRRAYAAFEEAGFDPSAGDKAVAGSDREPARLLAAAERRIAIERAAASADAAVQAYLDSVYSVALMLLAGVAGLAALIRGTN